MLPVWIVGQNNQSDAQILQKEISSSKWIVLQNECSFIVELSTRDVPYNDGF